MSIIIRKKVQSNGGKNHQDEGSKLGVEKAVFTLVHIAIKRIMVGKSLNFNYDVVLARSVLDFAYSQVVYRRETLSSVRETVSAGQQKQADY